MASAEHTIPGISTFESGLRPQRVAPYRIYQPELGSDCLVVYRMNIRQVKPL